MRDPPPSPESSLDLAGRRLEDAIEALERAIGRELAQSRSATSARELEVARARERALEAVAAEASKALGRAADEVRAALAAEV